MIGLLDGVVWIDLVILLGFFFYDDIFIFDLMIIKNYKICFLGYVIIGLNFFFKLWEFVVVYVIIIFG